MVIRSHTYDAALGTAVAAPPRLWQARSSGISSGSSIYQILEERYDEKLHGTVPPVSSTDEKRTAGSRPGTISTADAAVVLARASEVLTRDVDAEAAIQEVLPLLVPQLADWVVVDVASTRSGPALAASLHKDPGQAEPLQHLAESFCGSGIVRMCSDVQASGREQARPNLTTADIAALVHEHDHVLLFEQLGTRALLIAPLATRGTVMGTVTIALTDAPAFAPAYIEFALDLAGRIALAIDNRRLYEHAQRASREMELRLGTIFHDLSTPLSTIFMAAELMKGRIAAGASPEQLTTTIDTVLRSVERTQHMMREALDLAQIDAGSLQVQRTPRSLAELLRPIVAALSQPAARTVVLDVPFDADSLELLCDGDRIIRAVSNLIVAALKKAPRPQTITLSADQRPHNVVVSFETADSWLRDRLDQSARTGAGDDQVRRYLCLARGILAAHGGLLDVSTAPDRVAAVWFALPYDPSLARPANGCASPGYVHDYSD
jgi:signal transduction histidine kinase